MSEEPLSERPLTDCPNCGGEIDLAFSDAGGTIICVVCGSELNVVGLDPPEVEASEGE